MNLDILALTSIVRRKLKDDSFLDDDIADAEAEVMQVVKIYCKRDDIPSDLTYTVANMTVDLLKSQNLGAIDPENGIEGKIGIGAIAGVKVGDTEIKFTKGGNGTGAHVADVDAIIMNYKSQLNRFRKIRWNT